MTFAANLAAQASNINASGVAGAAAGGTGLAAPGTSGNVLTSNGTAWTSSALPAGGVTSLNGQTGAITNTNLYAIGSYITGRPNNRTNYLVDSTIAGSSLYTAPTASNWQSNSVTPGQSVFRMIVDGGTVTVPGYLINTGTWRCVSPAFGNGSDQAFNGLWVRIS